MVIRVAAEQNKKKEAGTRRIYLVDTGAIVNKEDGQEHAWTAVEAVSFIFSEPSSEKIFLK